ncbi:hypothetical protein P7K49_002305 [Saguinus oedipus]|uniref:Uncharacterized protein n=1 Tax=Saguinus oedipus TaxID=9490 RepID=A0ABQ9WH10_SAGOE|nr:hypothetical protein P7K49_002305 [Saguinus oedipus]
MTLLSAGGQDMVFLLSCPRDTIPGALPAWPIQGLVPLGQVCLAGLTGFPPCLLPETCDCEGYLKGHYVGLWRSFRLSCRERLGGLQEGKMSSGAESPELLTYEEVARYQHQPGERPWLVVLIRSLGAQLHELKQKVVAENPQHFGVAVPCKRARALPAISKWTDKGMMGRNRLSVVLRDPLRQKLEDHLLSSCLGWEVSPEHIVAKVASQPDMKGPPNSSHPLGLKGMQCECLLGTERGTVAVIMGHPQSILGEGNHQSSLWSHHSPRVPGPSTQSVGCRSCLPEPNLKWKGCGGGGGTREACDGPGGLQGATAFQVSAGLKQDMQRLLTH